MIRIFDRIFVGAERACPGCGPETGIEPSGREFLAEHGEDWAVVHACKSPCHQYAVGYKGNLDKAHPNYLVLDKGRDLYLNMIDPPVPMFPPVLFSAALRFADQHWNAGRSVLFHCNEGRSRAPSLALLYIAKMRRVISNESYEAARRDFEMRYEFYSPGKGIVTYLTENWSEAGRAI